MEWDALLLSRLQFAFTVGSHIIFPAFWLGDLCAVAGLAYGLRALIL